MTLIERIQTEPLPEILFHYTDSKGFLGILESNTLWATSARYLNDSSEYTYGMKLIADALEERSRTTNCERECANLQDMPRPGNLWVV